MTPPDQEPGQAPELDLRARARPEAPLGLDWAEPRWGQRWPMLPVPDHDTSRQW